MRRRVVVDTSAVLAMLFMEAGGDRMAAVVGQAYLSTVNLAEIVAKLMERGQSLAQARQTLAMLQMDVVPLDADLAIASGALRPVTRAAGLSVGDRCCLALGQRMALPVLTADRTWTELNIGIEIDVIR